MAIDFPSSPTNGQTLTAAGKTWTWTRGSYAVGDVGPGGGFVFTTPSTVGNTTGNYFEVAPFSTEVTRVWAQPAYQTSLITGADGLILGTGYQNTLDIIAQGNNDPALCAAKYCDVLTSGGVSDWFLPSKNELRAIRDNLIVPLNLGDFNNLYQYASSSEYDADEIWAQTLNVSSGTQFRYFKDASYNVRAIRSFTFTEEVGKWVVVDKVNNASNQIYDVTVLLRMETN